MREAYGRAATDENAENGFRASGVWPVNGHVFSDSDFIASETLQARNTHIDEFNADDEIPLSRLSEPTTVPAHRGCSAPVDQLIMDSPSTSKLMLSTSLEEIAHMPTVSQMPARKAKGIQRTA